MTTYPRLDGLEQARQDSLIGTLVDIAVGDIDSDEKGTGARMNAGKEEVGLILVRHWAEIFKNALNNASDANYEDRALLISVRALSRFQEGQLTGNELLKTISARWLDQAVPVMEYGMLKYSRWNWLKGMPWTVPLASAVRHAKAVLLRGEDDDPESGLKHIGHYTCNILMLATYWYTYPEGNDFPRQEYFK